MTSALDPENVRWLHWQSMLLMGGPIYVPAGPGLDGWRISPFASPGARAWSIEAIVDPRGPRPVWVRTCRDERFIRPALLVSRLLLHAPEPVTLPYRATVVAGEAVLPLGSSRRIELQLRTCHDAWIGVGQVGDRWVEVGARGVAVDAVRLEEVTDISAVPEEHGGLGGATSRSEHVLPLPPPDREEASRRLWEPVTLVGGPFYVPSKPGLGTWRVGGTQGPGRGSSYCISATVINEDRTSLRVTTTLDDSDISEPRMARQLVALSVREPVSFPYTATVTAREAAIPAGSGSMPLRVVECGQMWMGCGKVGDRWVLVESLGVSLDGLRLEEVADASSVPHDRRGLSS